MTFTSSTITFVYFFNAAGSLFFTSDLLMTELESSDNPRYELM